MFKKIEIFRLFYYIVFSLLIAITIGTAFIWIKHLYQDFQDEVVNIREHYIDLNKSVVEKEVQSIVSYIEYRKTKLIADTEKSIVNKLHEVNATSYEVYNNYRYIINDSDLKDIIRIFLRASKFGNGAGYVFALDSGGVLEVHPKSELEGKHFGSLDDMSTRIGNDRLRKIQEEGRGFLSYAWASRILPGESCPKLAFVEKFAPYDWWIGTGECLDIGERKLQEEILDWLKAIFVQTDGPFLVFDAKGNRLVSRDREKRGANALETTGENSLQIIREGIPIGSAPEGGFVEHDASAMPDAGNPVRMISYFMGVPGWQWTIGAGFKLDKIDAYVAGKREELASNVARSIGMTAIGLMFAVASLLVILSYFSGKMAQSLNALSSFFAKAAKDSAPLDAVEMNFEEFQQIAGSAKRMVEERQKAEEALKKQAEFQQLMIDALPVPVFIKDSNETYIGCNKAFEALIGRSREEVIGQTARDVLPVELAQVQRNNDVTPSKERGVAVHEAIFQGPDNRIHHVLFHKAFFPGPDGSSGVIGGILDITERKRAESERMRLFAAMEQCAEAVLITDTDSTVLYVNPAFERLSGHAPGEIVGKPAEIIENVENETSFFRPFPRASWHRRLLVSARGQQKRGRQDL